MEIKSRWIKSMNDFCLTVVMTALGLFLCFSDSIVPANMPTLPAGGILVRSDMYVRLIGGIMLLLSLILFIKNLNFSKATETAALKFTTSSQGVLTFVALVIYALLLQRVGFAITTFCLGFFLVFLYMYKENKDIEKTRPLIIRMAIASAVFSLALLGVVYVMFGFVLRVSLP